MSFLDAFILGLIQGLTEFLPVSSSGHLVIAEALLKVKQPGVSFELIVHLGTLVAVIIYFRTEILRLIQSIFVRRMFAERRMVVFLIIGSIPAAVAGLLFKDFFEKTFTNPLESSIELIITGLILLIPYFTKQGHRHLSAFKSFLIGIGQAIAILPGISRSGTTITAGLLFGVKPKEAAEYSFLLSIPAIGGALLLDLPEMLKVPAGMVAHYIFACLVSFAFGLLAVYWVLTAVKRGKFQYFAYYCFAIGLLGVYLFW